MASLDPAQAIAVTGLPGKYSQDDLPDIRSRETRTCFERRYALERPGIIHVNIFPTSTDEGLTLVR
jgi:hypothetical protein